MQALGQAPGLDNGFKTKYSVSQLSAAGLTPTQPLGNHQQASLLRLDIGTGYQYWYGLPNFYTITRYNHQHPLRDGCLAAGAGGFAGPRRVLILSSSRHISSSPDGGA
ncbi:Membrane-bound lytic murein transglycosylase B precursor (plasmid) [Klebsiella aerogenes]|nr:Membrane-bound lytic murein transglycosylase B precursor [Klebsiella aerogenes]